MRRLIACCLVTLALAAGMPGLAADAVDFKTFLADPGKYDGKEILLTGFLSLEDYGKALFLTQEDYAEGRFENSVPLILPRNIIDAREAFQRTFVKVRAVYSHDCARPEMFCTAHPGQGVLGPVLEIWGERLPGNERPVYRKPALETAWDWMRISEAEDPDHEHIIQLAHKFAAAVKAGDRNALLALFETEARERMAAGLKPSSSGKSPSRSDWLLFSGQYNYREAFQAASMLTILPLRFRDDPHEPPVAAACFCRDAACLEKLSDPLSSQAVVDGSFVDPWKCVPFYKSASGWVVDDGFLLSMDEDSPYGNDLGVILNVEEERPTEDAVAIGNYYSHPRYTHSPFLTRLRERPRPRVVRAMQTGRTGLFVHFITPTGSVWSMTAENGKVTLEKVELEENGQ